MSQRISMSGLLPSERSMPSMSSIGSESPQTNGLSTNMRLALMIGTPVVLLGTGFYFYYHYYHKKKQNKPDLKSKTNVKKVVDSKTEIDSNVSLKPFYSMLINSI